MYCKITTTTDNKEIADKISKKIIELEYSPCVQIINNVHSVYRWNNKIEESLEYKLSIKTINKHTKGIIKIICSLHNYEIPEIIKCNISLENPDYQKWFLENIKN